MDSKKQLSTTFDIGHCREYRYYVKHSPHLKEAKVQRDWQSLTSMETYQRS